MARRRRKTEEPGDVGFQIAPMIDVVFVVLVFFMSLTGTVKIEHELNTKLPGNTPSAESTDFPDESIVTIETDGAILLNDEPIALLTELRDRFVRIKANADNAKTRVLVTISSAPEAPYHRTIDALNALAAAQIENVTFTVDEDF